MLAPPKKKGSGVISPYCFPNKARTTSHRRGKRPGRQLADEETGAAGELWGAQEARWLARRRVGLGSWVRGRGVAWRYFFVFCFLFLIHFNILFPFFPKLNTNKHTYAHINRQTLTHQNTYTHTEITFPTHAL